MNLLLAVGERLARDVRVRVTARFPSLSVAIASGRAELRALLERGRYDLLLVDEEHMSDPDVAGRARLCAGEVVPVSGEATRTGPDRRSVVDELVGRIDARVHDGDREADLDWRGGFDPDALAARYVDRPDIMREMFRIYQEEAPQRVRAIRDGIAAGEFAAIVKAAHSLANTSGALSSMPAVRAARSLEEAARGEDLPGCGAAAGDLLPLVEEMVSRIGEALESGL